MSKSKTEGARTLQRNVVKRFLSKKQFKKFIKEYDKNKHGGFYGRFGGLVRPLTKTQRESLLLYYFGDKEKSFKQVIADSSLKTPGSALSSACRAALKILYQNKDKLNLEKLLKGGDSHGSTKK